MKHHIFLHQTNRKKGSYFRKDFLGDVLYYTFIYRDLNITFAKKGRKNTIPVDLTANRLLDEGYISSEELLAYQNKVASLFSLETLKDFDQYSLEDLYDFIVNIRKQSIGDTRLKEFWLNSALESKPLKFENCLDQSALIEEVCDEKDTFFVAITESELSATMTEFLSKSCFQNKKIVFITSDTNEKGLPSKKDLSNILKDVSFSFVEFKDNSLFSEESYDFSRAFLLIFGESGLLDARNLRLPCGILCNPKGYHACAVAGQLGLSRPAAVYVPEGFSIIENVPVTKPSRLTYLVLAKLVKEYGKKIYLLSASELYARYPNYFFNVYETDPNVGTENVLTLSCDRETLSFEEFDNLKSRAIQKHLDSFSNCRYYTKLFTPKKQKIKGNILVHGVRIKKSDNASVIPCGKSNSLRKKMRQMHPSGTGITSNFLFFLTPKLATLYNNLRYDRPDEQAEVDAGHLDYLLEYRNGKRVETFPLFRKTCIGLKENGEFIFFNFRLGGGSVTINGFPFSWNEDAVDPDEKSALPPVCIFTPYCSVSDGDADRETYRKAVGENRINFVLIQERVTAIREGNVFLPGMGVVISLEKSIGESLCRKLNLEKNEKGYFPADQIKVDVLLNAPKDVSENDWRKVKWAYGGGLSLILDGVGLCDGDHMNEWFEKDGWTSPLSRQTQESALHTLAKHPRTAIGTTKNGDLVILVFSGRTAVSDGADYEEMCIIARALIPDIRYLMNVDGGGSAMLGMVHNGGFTELSLPSTSTGSTVGMVRPVHTVLHIPLK